MGVSKQTVEYQICIPDLDDFIMTVHTPLNEQMPERSQEYFEKIDNNLSTKVEEKAQSINDYMNLIVFDCT